jgi:hypothetical protein
MDKQEMQESNLRLRDAFEAETGFDYSWDPVRLS